MSSNPVIRPTMQSKYPSVSNRLESFRGTKENWDGEGAPAIEDEDIEMAYTVLYELDYIADCGYKILPEPLVYAGPGSGKYPVIEFVWKLSINREFELEVSRTEDGQIYFNWLLAPRLHEKLSWEEGEFKSDRWLYYRVAIKEFISWLPTKEEYDAKDR